MNTVFRQSRTVLFVTGVAILFYSLPLFATTTRQSVEKPLRQSIDIRQKTQKTMDGWQNDRGDLTAQFDALKNETANLETYRDNLQKSIEAARKRLAAKEEQLAETEKINEGISPFLDELLSELREVSGNGVPFLAEERRKRLAKMEEMMDDPQVSVSEKYRRLMEALQIEAEYGFTTDVYRQEIDTGAGKMLVDIFRLGRLNLFYLSLDGRTCGFYDEASGKWQQLDESRLRQISSAIAMAKKERPVNFVTLPLGEIGTNNTETTGD